MENIEFKQNPNQKLYEPNLLAENRLSKNVDILNTIMNRRFLD